MKQIFSTPSFIQVLDVPAPMVHRGHVLVEVKYSFISSGTELAAIESTSISNNKTQFILKESYSKVKKLATYLSREGIAKTVSAVSEKMNGNRTAGERLIPLGYSCSGRVVSVGEGVTLFRSGDYVACAGANKATHSELVLVPENLAVSIPKGCDLKDASSVAVGAIAMQAVRRSGVALGESVAVIGLGLMGQTATKMLKCSGARVVGFDVDVGAFHPARMYRIENDRLVGIMEESIAMRRRQDLPPIYIRSGDVYACKRDIIFNRNSMLGNDCRPLVISPNRAINIDTLRDIVLAEYLLRV